MSFDINAGAVAVALVVQQVLGLFWFTVVIRCANWLRLIEKTPENPTGRRAVRAQVISIICSAAAAVALALVVSSMEISSFGFGMLAGFVAGLGFVGSATLMSRTYEQRDPASTWLFITYQTVSLAIMGGVIAVMR